ncbi:MAG: 1-acyl-sn-glycerol-3-phosphate acyltransferase [Bacteroidaceae bacterium]|nr:1-acyl-sn-glycerol-3-phosphate acyltransferase [Bacteroidaceae bacterium]
MKPLYLIYQYCIAFPVMLIVSFFCALAAIVCGTLFGMEAGWWTARVWGWLFCRMFLLPVKVEGKEKLDRKQAYIIVGNHQSMFDIFLMLGFMPYRFKWMMKKELSRIPLIGFACKCCGFITVDRTSKADIVHTMSKADELLRHHNSLAMFAEGTRTLTGKLGPFKRGAFKLAVEQQLPIAPVSINGTFEVMPKGQKYVRRFPLRLVIHDPIFPEGTDGTEIDRLRDVTREAVLAGLDEQYKE